MTKKTDTMPFNQTEKSQLKKIQSRFFTGNILGQRGDYMTKEEVDQLRASVIRPFKSKKLKKSF